MKKTMLYLVIAVMVMMTCTVNVSATSKKTELNKKSITLVKGKRYTLKLKGIKSKKVIWSSSNKKIATVKNGIVTGKKIGKCRIAAKYNKKKYSCKITVKNASNSTKIPDISDTEPGTVNDDPYKIGTITDISQIKTSAEYSYVNNTDNVKFTMVNNADVGICFGMNFNLEVLKDGLWSRVDFKENVAFPAIAMILKPHESTESNICLDNYFGKLPAGTYQISKCIQTDLWAKAEFIIPIH